MLRTHRQRVPAMLAVACIGMMVYAVAGAAPDDGQQLAPAAETTVPVAKSDSDKDGKASATDDCKGSSTSTTRKDGDGKGTTSTTRKDGDGDGDGKGTTSTTRKDGDGDGDGKGTTSTTRKDDDGKGTTSTTAKDGDGDDDGKSTTSTTEKGGDGDVSPKAEFNTAAADKGTTATTAKDDASKSAADKDDCESTTSTTDKGGKGSTTTTRKSGDGKDDGKNSTTTTDRKDRPTTTTTEKTVEPTTPPSGGGPGSGGGDSGGPTDPGSTPMEPQEAPPYDPSIDRPVDDPGVDEGEWYEMPEEGPVEMEDEYAFGPMPAPGEAQPVIPTLTEYNPRSGGKASVSSDRSARPRNRDRSGRDQEVSARPFVMSSSGAVRALPGQTQSAAVSRKLAGLQSSVTESAFPADIISTPKVFPINRRDPLAAAALVLLVGVSRELFKSWRRRASDYWPV